MMKIRRKIFLISSMIFMSAVSYGKDVFANYGVSFGKINLTQTTVIDNNDFKRIDGQTYQITGSGNYRIMDQGGRRLNVTLNQGVLDGVYEEYYANGNLYTTGRYVNGKKEGEWTVYSENGKVWKKYQYKNDNLNGRYISYYGNTGMQEIVGDYLDGKATGTWTYYFQNGSIEKRENYIDGKKNGLFTEWYSNGNKKSEINYVDGEVNGKVTVYYSNGRVFYEGNLQGNSGSIKGYYTDGSLGFSGNLTNRKRTGTWTYYTKSGSSRTVNY